MIPPFGPQHRMVGPGDPAVFAFRFDHPARCGLRAVGMHPADDRILFGSAGLDVRFGPWQVKTPSANVIGAQRSGPLSWWGSIGARYSVADGRLVLGASRHGAVTFSFDDPVVCPHRRGSIHLTSLTVTTAEPDELVAAVRALAARVPWTAGLDDGSRRST